MSTEKTVNVAIAGASGAVGEALVEILQERQFAYREIALLQNLHQGLANGTRGTGNGYIDCFFRTHYLNRTSFYELKIFDHQFTHGSTTHSFVLIIPCNIGGSMPVREHLGHRTVYVVRGFGHIQAVTEQHANREDGR